MTTYHTRNPLGSTAVKDLYDNAENLDHRENDLDNEQWGDRFGVPRLTWYGIEKRHERQQQQFEDQFEQFLLSSGYEDLGDYGPGLELTSRNQVFRYNGELYRASAALDLPYTTTGTWGNESSLFVSVGDGALRQELAGTPGGDLVGFKAPPMRARRRTVQRKLEDAPITPQDYGAICDGASHPLSTRYSSLAAAQADYPSAQALTDELDAVAMQLMFDDLQDGEKCAIVGFPRVNVTLYLSNKNNVEVDASGATVLVATGARFALIVHGGVLDRTLTGSAWTAQLLDSAYETQTPSVGVRIRGLRIDSATGAKMSTQVMAYFCNDLYIDADIANSNGSGVEFRHCVGVKFGTISVKNWSTYALFVYQCHQVVGDLLSVRGGGRAYAIKQRHKFYQKLSHSFRQIEAVDLTGFDDPAWATGGDAFNDVVRDPSASAAAKANRNFPGHEICRDVTFGTIAMSVSDGAAAAVSNPSLHVGCFADSWTMQRISLDANGKSTVTIPIILGSRGDIAEGKAGGATFGQGHVINSVIAQRFQATNVNPLVNYGVPCVVRGVTVRDSTLGRIATQFEPNTSLPFGYVSSFEFRDADVDIYLLMGGNSDRGLRILADTLLFISGGNKIRVRPANSAANNLCCPVYVASPSWQVVGKDQVEVLPADAVGSNHAISYGIFSNAANGYISADVTVAAPTEAVGIFAAGNSTRALSLNPGTIFLNGTPSGARDAIRASGEVLLMSRGVQSGAWTNAVADLTGGKNSGQANRRTVYLTAAPTSGNWNRGDVVINSLPSTGAPRGWRCTADGTPGTWISEGNL